MPTVNHTGVSRKIGSDEERRRLKQILLSEKCDAHGGFIVRTAAGTDLHEIRNPPHVHQPLIQTIVDELHGRGKCPSTGESGARTSWVLDECVRDYYSR